MKKIKKNYKISALTPYDRISKGSAKPAIDINMDDYVLTFSSIHYTSFQR